MEIKNDMVGLTEIAMRCFHEKQHKPRALGKQTTHMINLKKMTNTEFDDFKERTINSYAEELVKNIGLSTTEAITKSKKETEYLLKDGLKTANHKFLSIIESDSRTNVGHIWVQLLLEQGEAFIYHIEVLKDFQNRGYGSEALKQLENMLHENSISRIRLNVFEKNSVAKSLYEKRGFQTTNVQMQKEI